MNNINFKYYKPRTLVSFIVLLGVLLIPIKLWVFDHWGLPLAIPVLILLLLVWIDQKLWRYRPVRALMLTVPDMRGTYRGRINYENEKGSPGSLSCELVVRQTASEIWVDSRYYKEDGSLSSESSSDTANILKKNSDVYSLVYTFTNPGSDQLEMHGGTSHLDFRIEDGIKILAGRYYNSRRRKGALEASTITTTKTKKKKK